MKLQNTFVQSKLNQDIDERLLPKGQYPDALNIRVANSEGSDVGAIENTKGNERLTNLGLTNGRTIGAYADGSNQKLYWFVTSDTKDLVLEYDVPNKQINTLLESSRPSGVLNFNSSYLITGVVKIINGDSDKDLLVWTDDYNAPRIINIERSKEYGVDGFSELDIALIKRPPRYAPTAIPTYSIKSTENNLENKFLAFATRYKYLDGGYSVLSSFTNYQFAPSDFDLDYQSMENRGMSNTFNAVKIYFDTGDKRVTDVQLVYKEANSNTLYLVESFNKEDEGWEDNEEQSFTFTNNKSLIALSEDELFRTYDNVPLKAKALELIGSRIAFGNYVEQYDLKNIYGESINIDTSLTLIQNDLTGEEVNITIDTLTNSDDLLTIDLEGITLSQGNKITFSIDLNDTSDSGSYVDTFDFIFNKDFIDVAELALDEDFKYFVETLWTAAFESSSSIIADEGTIVISSNTGFIISNYTSSTISIKAPTLVYTVGGSSNSSAFKWEEDTTVFYREVAVASSLKTNRSYEVGIIYMDADGRKTFVQTDKDNTIYVDQKFSTYQNKIVVNINHLPPVWADRYKLVFKQNKGDYQTIYTNLFYEDGLYRWVKLDGANSSKVVEGDTLIVKSDLGGVVDTVTKVRVLEIKDQQSDFLGDPEDDDNIIEEAGLYMKIKPVGVDMSYNNSTIRNYEGNSHMRYPRRTYTEPVLGEYDEEGVFTPYPISAGSRIRLQLSFKASGKIAYSADYDKSFKVSNDYESLQEWFEAEVVDLGSFGENYTRGTDGGYKDPVDGGEYDYGYGFSKEDQDGFTQNGEKFYIWSHKDGTASRSITTTVNIEVLSADGDLIFETEPEDKISELFYETAQTFDIIDGYHSGNILNQDSSNPSAIVESDFFNCFSMGNGAESYRFKDARYTGSDSEGNSLLSNSLNIDLRPTTTSIEDYREVRRYADITYSEPYNDNSNSNGLGVFNLAKANYKEDLDKKYGSIQKMFFRDTNLLIFQEDKVGFVMFGKDILYNADGTYNVTSLESVLGDYKAYTGEYGISKNPESFAFDANNVYFMDSKRGCVCRLGADGINEISMAGMRKFFKDDFKDAIDHKKLGSHDPYLDQYVAHSSDNLLVRPSYIKCSGSFIKQGVSGEYTLGIDYGLTVGTAGFDYSSNGVPVRYDIKYNGVTYSTGFVGDPSYNEELTLLGYPEVSGEGTGVFEFDKNESYPREVTVTITAPLCDTDFSIKGNCIEVNNLTVVNIILNDNRDEESTIKSRYKWYNETYSSPFTTYDSVFGEGEVELFSAKLNAEGSSKVPLTSSTVRVESYKGVLETLEWNEEENKIGYLISNNLYTESEIEDIISNTTFPTINVVENGDGSTTRYVEFNFDRPNDEAYLYIIWDYRDAYVNINKDTKIYIYFDSSGSMDTTLAPLETMRDTLLKYRLIDFYGGDEEAYNNNVNVISNEDERTFDMLNILGDTPEGNVISLVFQDEASTGYHSYTAIEPLTTEYIDDITTFRNRLDSFPDSYYRGVVFQVDGDAMFKQFLLAVETGTGSYAHHYGLAGKDEVIFRYDIEDGGTPEYYLEQIVNALEDLGYEL